MIIIMSENIRTILNWFLDILDEQDRTVKQNIEISKKWKMNWIDFTRLQKEGSIFSKVDVNNAFLVGVFIQAINQFNNLTQEFLKPYREKEEYDDIPDNLLIVNLSEEESKNYLQKLEFLTEQLKEAVKGKENVSPKKK